MDIQAFITLLAVLSAVSGVITQAVKKMLDDGGAKYSSNVLALIVGMVTGTAGTLIYTIISGIPLTGAQICVAVLMGLAVWLSSMQGYDKIKQLLEQIGGMK